MKKTKLEWKGVFPAIITPFDQQGNIDETGFCRHIEHLGENKIHGIVVCGGGGEYWALTTEERIRIYQLAVRTAKKDMKVIASTSSSRMQEALDLTAAAKSAGCDGVMIEPPSYYVRPSRKEIINYYQEFDKIGIPMVVYNYPGVSGVNLTPDIFSELADLPNVAAIKESSEKFGQVIECIKLTGDRLVIFVGFSVLYGVASVVMGADGYISTEPNFVPRMTLELYELVSTGRIEEAKQLQMRMVDLYKAIFQIPKSYQAVLKAAMNLLGLPGGYPRPPIAPLSEDEMHQLKLVLERLGLRSSR